jgi:hypothetical protein
VKVLKPILECLKAFYFNQILNMLVLMLDPHFKSLQVMKSFVGYNNAICIAIEYDVKEVIPLLMTLFYQLNPTIEAIVTPRYELAL